MIRRGAGAVGFSPFCYWKIFVDNFLKKDLHFPEKLGIILMLAHRLLAFD
ncbi:hypothetical protein [Paenibacillus sp. IITD108]